MGLFKRSIAEFYMVKAVEWGYNHNHYSEKYRNAERTISSEEKERIDHFISILPCKEAEVLDIGCGDGSLYDAYMENECCLTLIDISRKMIEKAKANVMYADYICGDFLKYQFDKQFDGITMFYAFYHIPLTKQLFALKKMRDLLMPNGVILMNVRREACKEMRQSNDWCGSIMVWQYEPIHNFLRICRRAGFETGVYPSYENKDYAWVVLTKK